MALIEIRNVSKRYIIGEQVLQVLNNVSIAIEKGDFVAITGPSGSGKSTLMNLLGLLDKPTEGQFFLDSKDILKQNDDQLARLRNEKIGFVFQSFNLLPKATSLRNVEMPLIYAANYQKQLDSETRKKMARKALERVGLGERLHHKPSELSGGQKQRVAVARAVVNEPVILLADEPTGNLDSKSGTEVIQMFHELHAQGVTIILVTHDPKIAEIAHRKVVFFDGQIVEDKRRAHT